MRRVRFSPTAAASNIGLNYARTCRAQNPDRAECHLVPAAVSIVNAHLISYSARRLGVAALG